MGRHSEDRSPVVYNDTADMDCIALLTWTADRDAVRTQPPGDYGELNIWAVTNGALSRSMPNEAAVNLGTNIEI